MMDIIHKKIKFENYLLINSILINIISIKLNANLRLSWGVLGFRSNNHMSKEGKKYFLYNFYVNEVRHDDYFFFINAILTNLSVNFIQNIPTMLFLPIIQFTLSLFDYLHVLI